MHYDKKTGLAIAVLLIGAAAAVFFRIDSIPSEDVPELKQAESIDHQIEGDNLPYPDLAKLAGTIEDRRDRNEVAGNSNNGDWNIPLPDFLNTNDNTLHRIPSKESRKNDFKTQQRISQNPPTANSGTNTPVPIKIDKKKFGSTTETIPQHNHEWQVDSRSRNTKKESLSRSREGESIYTIRSGDTLSGLASRFLGSSGRYFEIYRANRDIIDNPDNLLPGTEIRIPGERPKRTKTLPVSTDRKSTKTNRSPKDKTRSERPSSAKQTARENEQTTLDLQPKLIPARRRVYFRTPRWRKSKK